MDSLTPAVFHVLLALSRARLHGYGIAKDVREQTEGVVHMGAGTLYGTLQRLMDAEWIEVSEAPPNTDGRRRYYRLTTSGRSALDKEVARMESLVRVARRAGLRPKTSRT
jgi:DNA-binding PadR family transcriptional regulator